MAWVRFAEQSLHSIFSLYKTIALNLKQGPSRRHLWDCFFFFLGGGGRWGLSGVLLCRAPYLMHDIQDMAGSLRVVCLSSDGIGTAGAHRCLQRVQQGFAITTHLDKTQHFAVTVSQLQTVLFTCYAFEIFSHKQFTDNTYKSNSNCVPSHMYFFPFVSQISLVKNQSMREKKIPLSKNTNTPADSIYIESHRNCR